MTEKVTINNAVSGTINDKDRAAIKNMIADMLADLGSRPSKTEVMNIAEVMDKTEVMDKFLLNWEGTISSAVLFQIVEAVFGISLQQVPVLAAEPELAAAAENTAAPALSLIDPGAAMDKQLAVMSAEAWTSGAELRQAINAVFGVNLDAIAGLGQCRISLHSKGQWIVRNDRDLVLVWTGAGDVDVRVSPTRYFTEHTGLNSLPHELRSKLAGLGYTSETADGAGAESFYYAQPDGQPVPDAFKGQTMGAIIQTLRVGYMDL
ncbi:hypothetical protein [Paenibacillus pinistramenti]|uniref:hypothetical protein n=1 Tax=Paenibacillus pinistramenti TaxID=1768003 RepID=UPI001108A0F1|nr:hypothetical protein [Paenibacillus pinistramenti]